MFHSQRVWHAGAPSRARLVFVAEPTWQSGSSTYQSCLHKDNLFVLCRAWNVPVVSVHLVCTCARGECSEVQWTLNGLCNLGG